MRAAYVILNILAATCKKGKEGEMNFKKIFYLRQCIQNTILSTFIINVKVINKIFSIL